ncbi:MAG: hypothetical protein AAGN66_28485 [Acidobacteriota bacterium]
MSRRRRCAASSSGRRRYAGRGPVEGDKLGFQLAAATLGTIPIDAVGT